MIDDKPVPENNKQVLNIPHCIYLKAHIISIALISILSLLNQKNTPYESKTILPDIDIFGFHPPSLKNLTLSREFDCLIHMCSID